MKQNEYLLAIFLLFFLFQVQSIAQPTVPDTFTVRLQEAVGDGCGGVTDCDAGILCLDVYVSINQDGWALTSYNYWMNYGPDNSILSYLSDSSCNHTDIGDLDVDILGKYRFTAFGNQLPLTKNTEVIVHNFCLTINEIDSLDGLDILIGGSHFDFVSSMAFVDPLNITTTVNVFMPADTLTLSSSTLSCLNDTMPPVTNICDSLLLVHGIIPTETYHASSIVRSSGLVNGVDSVVFKAGSCIELDTAFEVQMGAIFYAEIEPCTQALQLIEGQKKAEFKEGLKTN